MGSSFTFTLTGMCYNKVIFFNKGCVTASRVRQGRGSLRDGQCVQSSILVDSNVFCYRGEDSKESSEGSLVPENASLWVPQDLLSEMTATSVDRPLPSEKVPPARNKA